MKIAFVTIYFPPIAGGEGNNVYYLARELAKKHEVHVFTLDRKKDIKLKKEEKRENIHIHRFSPKFHFGYHFVLVPSLVNKVIKNKFDIIHFHSFGVLFQDSIIRKIKDKKTVLINTPAHPSFSFQYNWFKRAIIGLVKNFEKYVINPKYDKIIAISENQEKWMQEWNIKKEKIELVPCGITEEQFIKTNKEKVKDRLKLKNKKIIGYLGRIQEYKGVWQIVEILPELKKQIKDIKVLLIGEDIDYKQKLIEKAKRLGVEDNILFFGRVNEKEKRELLSILDLFILPSKIEGFGIVMLEAMAQKVPIISTKTDGGNFLIEEDKNGFLYGFGDKERLLKKTLEILQNKKLSKQIGENNFHKAKDFLWKNQGKKLEKIYLKEFRRKNDQKI